MPPAALDTEAELDRAARIVHPRVRLVLWRGQPAWLKPVKPTPPHWRDRLLAGLAAAVGLPEIQPLPPHGGRAALALEVRRLAELRTAGLRVPLLLTSAPDWLLLSHLGHDTLETRLGQGRDPDARLQSWRVGADYLVATHAAGHYLGQAFARNFVWSDAQGLGAIDFEDDALARLTLTQAQVRDWLTYGFSTACYFPGHAGCLAAAFGHALANEPDAVRLGLGRILRRVRWLERMGAWPRRLQGRDWVKAWHFGELARQLGDAEKS